MTVRSPLPFLLLSVLIALPSVADDPQKPKDHGEHGHQESGHHSEGHSCEHAEGQACERSAEHHGDKSHHGKEGHHQEGHSKVGHHGDGHHGEEHSYEHGEGHHGEESQNDGHGHDVKADDHHSSKHGDLHSDGHHRDFSDVERWSQIFDSPQRDAWQRPREVIGLMAIEAGMTVADLGAGTGYFMPYLSAAAGEKGHALALDIEDSLVDHITKRAASAGLGNVEARVIPKTGPGLDDGSVDRLLIVNTWHHLDDRPSYTRRISRALKTGGRLIIVDYTLESEAGPPKEHRLAPERVIAEIEAGGMTAEILEEELPRQYVIVARHP